MTELKVIFDIQDLDEVVEEIGKVLQRSVIIENSNFELLAYNSPNDFPFDATQQKTILTKKCPLFIIERLKKEGIIKLLQAKDRPIRLNSIEDIGFCQRVAFSLKFNDQIVGYFWMHEANDLLKESEMLYLERIAPHIGKVIYNQHTSDVVEENETQEVLLKLVNHDYLNEHEIRQEANIVSFYLPRRFAIIVASVIDPAYLYLLDKIRNIINSFKVIKTSSYLGKGTEVIGLVSGDEHREEDAILRSMQLASEIKDNLSEEERTVIFIGIGDEYRQVHHIRKSFLEALEVIEIKSFVSLTNKVPLLYSELEIFRFIKKIYKKHIAEGFINKGILKLMQHDEENQSELVKTLRVYMSNDCKSKQTAEQLFIHPNTLNYRLKQVFKITTITLESIHMKFDLYIELLMIHIITDYYERYKQKLINI